MLIRLFCVQNYETFLEKENKKQLNLVFSSRIRIFAGDKEIKPIKPNIIMKKQYLHLICAVCMVVVAYGGIKKCQEREAAEAQAPVKEAPAPAMEATAEMTAEEPMDSAQQAYFDRGYFEALVKIADGGKVYALDSDGKRSPKTFKTFDEYKKFITDNPQYPKNSYSYDADGKPINVDFKKTTIQKN